jgi:leucyl aminopeptidase
MADAPTFAFAPLTAAPKGTLVVLAAEGVKVGKAAQQAMQGAGDLLTRAATADRFTGKSGSALDIIAPNGIDAARLLVVGAGKPQDWKPQEAVKLGAIAMGKVSPSVRQITVLLDLPRGPMTPDQAADFAFGMRLRAYEFDRYKTKRKEGEEPPVNQHVTLAVADAAAARKAWNRREAIAEGVMFARDLVNEPPNVLYPEEFARRLGALKKLGLKLEVFDDRAIKKLGMNALLGVGQGSARESRVVVMRWNGGKQGTAPLAFIGKGVCFDTGGISIKPSSSMEDMKGDMAGAACVAGLMETLARRKAKANVVGAVGLVENMPDGNAQRPGDIVKSMSGQTIEIINTDAEGRLVLADLLWYVNQRFKPKMMIDLATLTGAIIVALGHDYAGLFSNDDRLSERLHAAGEATGEKVWRLPLGPEYDKLIDSKFADVKNAGGRHAGSITAAQFLQRFVEKTPWAHLDIAGTGMGSPVTDLNKSWGSGWGVRLLDQLVADYFEK